MWLQPIAGQPNAWIYLVEFVESPRTSKGAPIGSVLPRQVSVVVVLLDGRVPAPTVGRRQSGS